MATVNSNISPKSSKILPNGKSFTIHIVVSQWNKINYKLIINSCKGDTY